MHKLIISSFLVCFYVQLNEGGAFLPLCSENVTTVRLCKINEDHCPICPPKPWPVNVTPLLFLKDILDIDELKKTIKLYAKISFFWIDNAIFVDYPFGEK